MSTFAARLIAWQREHGRKDLPWQHCRDPYRIWISEIMLQQTRVDTAIPYYARFLERFPDLQALARASLDDVLESWSGLGYYARARNLHRAAQQIVRQYAGQFPEHPDAIATLPGIGRSTAAAIAVFAFGARAAILDGNVRRVLCRVFGIEGFPGTGAVQARLWELAASLLPERDCATYIQAQMDLGATLCTRARPSCQRCPLAAQCVARGTGRVADLPAVRPARVRPQRRLTVALIRSDNRILLQRRPPAGIWGGLLVPPEIPEHVVEPAGWLLTRYGATPLRVLACPPLEHDFTHFRLEIVPLLYELSDDVALAAVAEDDHVWLSLDRIDTAALPAPVRRLLHDLPLSSP